MGRCCMIPWSHRNAVSQYMFAQGFLWLKSPARYCQDSVAKAVVAPKAIGDKAVGFTATSAACCSTPPYLAALLGMPRCLQCCMCWAAD